MAGIWISMEDREYSDEEVEAIEADVQDAIDAHDIDYLDLEWRD